MRKRWIFALAVASSLAGCPAKGQQGGSNRNSGSAAPTPLVPVHGSQSMPEGFARAHASFREYAARVLGVAAKSVDVKPAQEEIANLLPEGRIGKLWRFDGTNGPLLQNLVRGWAAGDGTVVTPQENLGRFFEAAGVWSGSPLPADNLAKRLVWAMPGHQAMPGARLELDAGGSGRLVFVAVYNEGAAGSHPGPDQRYEYTIALTADHKATMSKQKTAGPVP
jgi:hypothetical protein